MRRARRSAVSIAPRSPRIAGQSSMAILRKVGGDAPVAVVVVGRQLPHGRPVGAFDDEFVDEAGKFARERQCVGGRRADDERLVRIGHDLAVGPEADDGLLQSLRPRVHEVGQQEAPLEIADGGRNGGDRKMRSSRRARRTARLLRRPRRAALSSAAASRRVPTAPRIPRSARASRAASAHRS